MNILDNVRVAKPCSAAWSQMSGDDRVRHCQQCKLNVFNLAGMTAEEARDLIRNREGRTCVRFYRRSDGTLITKDCPMGVAQVRMRVARLIATGAGLVLFAFAFGKIDPKSGSGKLDGFKDRARKLAPIRKIIEV
ncbi:MAG: hypothetical protein ABL962_20265, partial [Fimbriimonadaceae bacterium]